MEGACPAPVQKLGERIFVDDRLFACVGRQQQPLGIVDRGFSFGGGLLQDLQITRSQTSKGGRGRDWQERS